MARGVLVIRYTLAHYPWMRNYFILALTLLFLSLTDASLLWAQNPDELTAEVEMKPIQFSLYQRGRVRGQVTIQLVLQVLDPNDVSVVEERIPQIQSDFVSALIALSKQYFDVNQPIQPDLVAGYLQPFAIKRFGPDKVNIFVVQATINPV